jgi:hypothetical protein
VFRTLSMFTVILPVLFLYPVSRGIDELNKGVEVTVCIECPESCGTVDGDLRASQIGPHAMDFNALSGGPPTGLGDPSTR